MFEIVAREDKRKIPVEHLLYDGEITLRLPEKMVQIEKVPNEICGYLFLDEADKVQLMVSHKDPLDGFEDENVIPEIQKMEMLYRRISQDYKLGKMFVKSMQDHKAGILYFFSRENSIEIMKYIMVIAFRHGKLVLQFQCPIEKAVASLMILNYREPILHFNEKGDL